MFDIRRSRHTPAKLAERPRQHLPLCWCCPSRNTADWKIAQIPPPTPFVAIVQSSTSDLVRAQSLAA